MPMAPANVLPKAQAQFTIRWKRDGDSVRVWRDDWFADQFEVITHAELATAIPIFNRLLIPLLEEQGD